MHDNKINYLAGVVEPEPSFPILTFNTTRPYMKLHTLRIRHTEDDTIKTASITGQCHEQVSVNIQKRYQNPP